MVLLLTAPREFPLNQEFLCLSRNLSTVTTSKTKLRLAHDINMYCKWTTVILSCSTVAHPETFSLAIPGFTNEAEILFDSPVRKKLPTVACLPPTFLEERWQTLVVSIELYKFFGINFQVHYIQSGLKQIFDILKKYEEKEILEIREFPFLKLDQEYMDFLGYDPVNELDGRNQPMSYTDCLMRYREAADFIFIIDVDDIMIPFRNSDYISELNLLLNEYPTASAFVFPRFRAEAITVTSFHKFSLEKTLQSVRISNEGEVGKSVLIPGKAETAWLHWPGIGNESSREIPKEKSLFLHLRNWRYFENYPKALACEFTSCYSISDLDIITEGLFSNISMDFHREFQKNFKDFMVSGIYSSSIGDCYDNFGNWFSRHSIPIPCVTPVVCPVPKRVPDFSCFQVHQRQSSINLSPSLILHVPEGSPSWSESENGCRI